MKALSWLNFLLGVWLTIAAFALSAKTGSVMAAEGVGGVVISVLAYASAVSRPNAAAHTAATLNATIVGLAVLVLGSANAIYRHTPKPKDA